MKKYGKKNKNYKKKIRKFRLSLDFHEYDINKTEDFDKILIEEQKLKKERDIEIKKIEEKFIPEILKLEEKLKDNKSLFFFLFFI